MYFTTATEPHSSTGACRAHFLCSTTHALTSFRDNDTLEDRLIGQLLLMQNRVIPTWDSYSFKDLVVGANRGTVTTETRLKLLTTVLKTNKNISNLSKPPWLEDH